MKKGLIFLFGIVSFLGINQVSADTLSVSDYYDNFETYVSYYETYKEDIDYMINWWEENYSQEYPYYVVNYYVSDNPLSTYSDSIVLFCSSSNKFWYDSRMGFGISEAWEDNYAVAIRRYIDSEDYDTQVTNSALIGYFTLKSNDFIFDSTLSAYNPEIDTILFPSYTSDTLGISIPEIEITNGDVFPTVSTLYDNSYFSSTTDTYKEINLNDYSYVALSLKDYDTIPENNYSVYTNFYVKGQLCITPVYNYGMTERKDILTGTQVQACSSYYEDFTLTRMYILKEDVENNAIYYLKAYDTSKDNTVKVDTSVFDISYITEENEDNPQVTINGKTYPTLSYGSLTDSATKSEDEGYVSGVTCAVGDFNCYQEYNPSNIFDEIFSSPLEFLKSIWDSVTSIFSIIGEFISLLPDTMQSFLYLSFMIAIILGLIKLIL